MWLDRIPASVAFCDVETTGLGKDDRIVSFGGIGMIRGGSAALSAVCSHIKLARSGQLHAAIEDAWLAMQIYLWLHGCPFQRRLPGSLPRTPSNFRHVHGRQAVCPYF